jgi:four helix bundle protein
MRLNSAKDLDVYKKAYALTGQIRRSSRSVCLNLREAWSKRRYQAHFVSKLSDCDGENSETDSSLDFARDCGYIRHEQHTELVGRCQEVGKMLGGMIKDPQSFLISDSLISDF